MRGWRLQGLDRGRRPAGRSRPGRGRRSWVPDVARGPADRVREGGAVVLPRIKGLPFSPYRGRLYTPSELYAGLEDGYEATFDARPTGWSRRPAGRARRAARGGDGAARPRDRRRPPRGRRWSTGAWASWAGTLSTAAADGYRTRSARPTAGPAGVCWSRPAAGPGRWRRPTSARVWSRPTRARSTPRWSGWRRHPTTSGPSPAWARAAAGAAAETTIGVPTRLMHGHEPPKSVRHARCQVLRQLRLGVRTRCRSTAPTAASCSFPGPPGDGEGAVPGRVRELLRRRGVQKLWCLLGRENSKGGCPRGRCSRHSPSRAASPTRSSWSMELHAASTPRSREAIKKLRRLWPRLLLAARTHRRSHGRACRARSLGTPSVSRRRNQFPLVLPGGGGPLGPPAWG